MAMRASSISSRRSACRFSQSTGLLRARCAVESATTPKCLLPRQTAVSLQCRLRCCATLQARQHPWLSHNYDEAPVAPAQGAPASDGAAAPVNVPLSRPDAGLEQAETAPPAELLPTPEAAASAESSRAATTTVAPPTPDLADPDLADNSADELATKVDVVPDAVVTAGVEVKADVASAGGDNDAKTS
eukprot:COSAG02_NODE_1895_length_10468_cov_4.296268_5_plen_188_part_00